jgi:excisionase family DNA binding protein
VLEALTRHTAERRGRTPRFDKLWVTGSSPVPPISHRMVTRFMRAADAVNTRAVPTPVPTSDFASAANARAKHAKLRCVRASWVAGSPKCGGIVRVLARIRDRAQVDVPRHRLAQALIVGERLLTAAEVAELLAVPTSWVREHTRNGHLPHVVLGRYRRYRLDSVLAYIEEQEHGGASWRKQHPQRQGQGEAPVVDMLDALR